MKNGQALGNLYQTHAPIIAMQSEMKQDIEFMRLCKEHGIPWDIARGYEPRWYNGPAPEQVQVLFLMAEPGAITPTEARNLQPTINHEPWIGSRDLSLQENYWLKNLLLLCQTIWPDKTEANMDAHLGGSCTFWMSLPPRKQTNQIPSVVLNYFLSNYLGRFLALFPHAIILAAGRKAEDRLKYISADYESCSAFTRPEANKRRAQDSWRHAGLVIASILGSV